MKPSEAWALDIHSIGFVLPYPYGQYRSFSDHIKAIQLDARRDLLAEVEQLRAKIQSIAEYFDSDITYSQADILNIKGFCQPSLPPDAMRKVPSKSPMEDPDLDWIDAMSRDMVERDATRLKIAGLEKEILRLKENRPAENQVLLAQIEAQVGVIRGYRNMVNEKCSERDAALAELSSLRIKLAAAEGMAEALEDCITRIGMVPVKISDALAAWQQASQP
jgi:hypothetical protein